MLATATLILSCVRFGWNSLVSLGVLGTFIYSSPAFFGILLPFHQSSFYTGVFAPLHKSTLAILALVWVVLFFLLIFFPVPKRQGFTSQPAKAGYSKQISQSCVVLGLGGYLFISYEQGPLFFLQDRSEIGSSLIMLLWRWVPIFGLIVSLGLRRWSHFLFFFGLLLIYFIAGDRTIPAIAIASLAMSSQAVGHARKFMPPFRFILFGLFTFPLMIFGKLVYLSVKYQSTEAFSTFLNKDAAFAALASFEPVITINILNYSVENDLKMPMIESLSSIFGNILIMPSLFGVETNHFNYFFTNSLPYFLNFGVAGHYYAHGFVAFGVVGVAIFAVLFFISLFQIDRWMNRSSDLKSLTLVIIGTTIAIYAHRNGMDNLLSFIRQILMVSVAIWTVSWFTSQLKMRRPLHFRRS